MKNNLLIVVMLIATYCCYAQRTFVNRDWKQLIGTPDTINHSSSAIDKDRNVIVVSNTVMSANNTDILITKHNENGVLLWTRTFNGTANQKDYGAAVAVDANKNIFVTGAVSNTMNSFDIVTLKYDENGNLIWSRSYNGAANSYDVPSCLVLDANGNVYVGGGTTVSGITTDFITIKYDINGTLQWAQSYDYASLYDFVTGIKVDQNNVAVIGASANAANNWDYTTILYNRNNGSQVNVFRTNITGLGLDQPYSIAKDANGNLYVTGVTGNSGNKNIQTLKINSSFKVDWIANYDWDGSEDVGKSIGVDMYGNSYVTGHSYSSSGRSDFVTIKYDPNGIQLWSQRYIARDGLSNAKAVKALVTDAGDVYVVGHVGNGVNDDYRFIKYNPTGELVFEETYDGINTNDVPFDVQIDNNGNIYVVGGSYTAFSSSNTILKYTTYDKRDQVILDPAGKPDYMEDEVIVRFMPDVLDKTFLDNKNLTFAPLEDVVSPETYYTLLHNLNYTQGEKPIMVLKIFDYLTTKDTLSISRLGDTVRVPDFWNAVTVVFPTNINEMSSVTALNNTSNLVYNAEPNFLYEFNQLPNDPLIATNNAQESLYPSSTYPSGHINVNPAWDLEVGQPYIKVGVNDIPIYWAHEDFGNGTFSGSKIVDGKNFETGVHISSITSPGNNHGTSVAGIIGALRNNNKGIAGIAGGDNQNGNTGCSLYSLGSSLVTLNAASTSAATSGIVHGALSTGYGLNVINCSWGKNMSGYGQANNHKALVVDAIKTAWLNDCAVVASSGNDGQNISTYFPANLDDRQLLTVGGSGTNGEYFSNANYGGSLDVIAPYVQELVATCHAGTPYSMTPCNVTNPLYTCFNGTSSSAPHVSGVAALMMSRHYYGVNAYYNLGVEDVEHIIQKYATDISGGPNSYPVGYDDKNGWGRLNAGAAVAKVNTPQYQIFHYTNQPGYTSSTSQTASNIGIVVLNSPSLAAATYLGEQHRIVRTEYIDLTNQGSPWQIIDAWPKYNATRGAGSSSSMIDDHTANYSFSIYNAGQTLEVKCTTFVYRVTHTIIGQSISPVWYPYSPGQTQFSYSVHFFDPTYTDVPSITRNETLTLYPNPAVNSITIQGNKPVKDGVVQILDVNGKLLHTEQISQQTPLKRTIDISSLSNGIYFLKLISKDYVATEKFIK